MGVEIEIKFKATPEIQEEIRREIPGAEQHYDMRTTYYDTPDGALSQLHYTFRQRLENGVCVCTLKTPAAGGGRGEWETECDDIMEAVEKLCKLGCPENLRQLTAGGVKEVCGAAFHRVAKTVQLPEGVVEIALDRGVLTGGGKEIPLCEVEVELKEGSAEMVQKYATLLAIRYGMTQEKGSKFRRALALAKGE